MQTTRLISSSVLSMTTVSPLALLIPLWVIIVLVFLLKTIYNYFKFAILTSLAAIENMSILVSI